MVQHDTNRVGGGPVVLYRRAVQDGTCRADPAQEEALEKLQELYRKVSERNTGSKHSGLTMVDTVSTTTGTKSAWWKNVMDSLHDTEQKKKYPQVKGVYLYGGVGTGKTMVMDLFLDALPIPVRAKRTHFHDFMLNIHKRLRDKPSVADPVAAVAHDVSKEVAVLCLDEFMVADVADAMILNRLFTCLWEDGLVLVATSNRAPDQLYEGGLQRDLFLPFIANLKQRCEVHEIRSHTDYRRMVQNEGGVYFHGPGASDALRARFEDLVGGTPCAPVVVPVSESRELAVESASGEVAFLTFAELCDRPLAAADYIALCDRFTTVAIDDVPIFTAANRNTAYRFIQFIDIVYENRIRLLLSAEGDPEELFRHILTPDQFRVQRADEDREVFVDANLGFTKDRTISRLLEMQSHEYLLSFAGRHARELLQYLGRAAAA
eukprot:jgi/Pico_ML_1/51633/g2627.t1